MILMKFRTLVTSFWFSIFYFLSKKGGFPIFIYHIKCSPHVYLQCTILGYFCKTFFNGYEWAKWTNFLLAVMRRSPRRHSSSSKTFKKSENIDTKFYDHFRDNWIIWDDEPARPWRSLTTYFSKSIRDREVKFWKHHQSILQFVILKFDINIFDSLETMRSSAT